MPYTYRLTTQLPASPAQVYRTWLDSRGHSEMTGGVAQMTAEPGGRFSAWNGYIGGRNLELLEPVRIVQSWRTTRFEDGHEDSVITVTLSEADGGTLLTLEHANVPDTHTSYEQGGWQKSYFAPMQAYFARLAGAAPAAEDAPATPARRVRPSPKRARRTPVRAASRARKAPVRSKPHRSKVKAARPKTKRPKTKQAKAKPAKSKRAKAVSKPIKTAGKRGPKRKTKAVARPRPTAKARRRPASRTRRR
jgi:uncharacterized protein YndB with AHSA1/START domain